MNVKTILLALTSMAILAACTLQKQTEAPAELSLKEAFGDKFLIGAALNQKQIAEEDSAVAALIRRNFNAIVAENCMKCEVMHPTEEQYNFEEADKMVRYAEKNGMKLIGHCLIWHSQCAPWFCVDENGKLVSADVLKQRIKDHISTIMGHYKGRIHGWDVVNEAIMEDGSYRQSQFYQIMGEDFIPYAFQCAMEADPDAELYYNDYNMSHSGKRNTVVRLIRTLKEQNIRIDAIGLQGHMGIDYPNLNDFEESMLAFASEGVKVMITEWEMSALPTVSQSANISDTVAYMKEMNPYPEALPDSVSRIWNARMKAFFELFLKHSDIVTRVSAWGVTDGDSWKNDFPVHGRREYPLLFDRNLQPKPFIKELCNPKKAVFDSFVYSADEGEADETAMTNPLLPGCYPDPSICRVGEDYYLVNSSFAFYPGIPIWHSTDLKHWEQLGYVLNRPSQLQLKNGLRISGGIYAPAISYNPSNKLFYLITTDVDGGGNFFVTTDDPKKCEWSERTYLPEVGGIDPSFLFDEDGKAYIVNNDAPIGKPLYDGHRAIWVREFDWEKGCTVGKQQMIVNGGIDISQKPIWIEGPHLYHINGTYYLMAAEGGTGLNHSEVILSSASPFGPFKPCAVNPILTQRDLPADRPNPVTCTGHADLVQTAEGEWYAIFLAVRPYKGGHDVMGRETFLLPVKWENNQPVILPAGEAITYTAHSVAPTPLWSAEGLAKEAFFIRTPQSVYYDIDAQGKLTLDARSSTLYEGGQPSVIGRWITSNNICAETALSFNPTADGDFAGIALFQNDGCNISFGKTLDKEGNPCLKLTAYSRGELRAETIVPLQKEDADKKLKLQVKSDGEVNYIFSYSLDAKGAWTQVGEPVSADLLSTQTAGGFTGTMAGIYATGNYQD